MCFELKIALKIDMVLITLCLSEIELNLAKSWNDALSLEKN